MVRFQIFFLFALWGMLSCESSAPAPEASGQVQESSQRALETEAFLKSDYADYPISIPTKDTAIFLKKWDACQQFQTCQLKDLTSGQDKYIKLIDKKSEAMLGLFGLTGMKLGRKEKVMVIDYTEYKDASCPGQNQPVRVGVGVRVFIFIRNDDSGIKFNTPAQVAAAAELKKVQAELRLSVFGFTNETSRKVMEDFGKSGSDFAVEQYHQLLSQVSRIMASMQDTMQVEPVRIL
jgi:hypothetical protein